MLSTTTALPTETSWGDTLKSYQAERGLASWDKLGEAHPPKDHRVTHYEKRSKFNPLLQRHYDPRRERGARLRRRGRRREAAAALDKQPQALLGDDDFDPLLGRYYDAGKEADFAKQRAVLSSIAGQGSVARLPPAVQYCEGAAYDIVSHAVKDQAKLEVGVGAGNRAIAPRRGLVARRPPARPMATMRIRKPDGPWQQLSKSAAVVTADLGGRPLPATALRDGQGRARDLSGAQVPAPPTAPASSRTGNVPMRSKPSGRGVPAPTGGRQRPCPPCPLKLPMSPA
ncbi:hypothetical protein SO694_0002505 [Aureococcus anophagefferens]|uniref:Uncharacterized protein n=1 Tax=Aureococcus anophagefferens TaxID=44056 RepID=A0ABR1FV95_AURAN